ncbi:uncharacterized protein LOC131026403 isoform X2 [Salvia miltiorrhiza]|uniref:uncharacterized protein LOC131024361 isoform X3 n=1 Tax=Salvia miltiorrhiza TaxID=226208 RepID=UPI0025AD7DEB|nr:uncharacterized protein LOC131024361 isoform X3 [Salvia miltiorrhiza]XP_057812265.1 uncharacterized protein LOC131026403 isoform X2 [Salvia miltiorrhiza]
MNETRCVHKDHVSAVMDIDYSPTGREFVTRSYDRTGLLCEVQERRNFVFDFGRPKRPSNWELDWFLIYYQISSNLERKR